MMTHGQYNSHDLRGLQCKSCYVARIRDSRKWRFGMLPLGAGLVDGREVILLAALSIVDVVVDDAETWP